MRNCLAGQAVKLFNKGLRGDSMAKPLLILLTLLLFLSVPPSYAQTGFNCSACDCPGEVVKNTCDQACGGTCECKASDGAVLLSFIFTGGLSLVAGDSYKGGCGVGDFRCKQDSQCQFDCGPTAAPCCTGGNCACCPNSILRFEREIERLLEDQNRR